MVISNRIITIIALGLILIVTNWWLVRNSFDDLIWKQIHNNSIESHDDKDSLNKTRTIECDFEWKSLDFSRKPLCGADKCLFRSSMSHHRHHHYDNGDENHARRHGGYDDDVGYLVSKKRKLDNSLDDGWRIAQYLASRYGIQHFLLEAPKKVNVTTSALSHQHNIYYYGDNRTKEIESKDHDDDNDEDRKSHDNPLFQLGSIVTIQKIKIAQHNSQEIRLEDTKDEIFSSLDELIRVMFIAKFSSSTVSSDKYNGDEVDNANKDDEDYDSSKSLVLSSFLNTLTVEIKTTLDLLKCEPLLALDFQIFINTYGKIFHLDFDRMLSQFGGLYDYNQTKFDDKVRSKVLAASDQLQIIYEWINIKRKTQLDTIVTPPNTATTTFSCNLDWEKEESILLDAKNISCLAAERVAISRNTITGSMMSLSSSKIKQRETKMKSRLQHPLLLALIQRAIQDGFYGTDTKSWDCNAYGDRIQQSSSLLLVEEKIR